MFDEDEFNVVYKEEVPDGEHLMGGSLLLAVKIVETNKPVYKARLVVQRHTDNERGIMVHSSINERQNSVRVLAGMVAKLGFRLWSQDVSQVDIQAGESFMSETY